MSQDKKHLDSKVSEQDISASKIAKCVKEEPPEPEEGKNPWPYAVWLFFGIMIGWGATYMALEVPHGLVSYGDQRQALAEELDPELAARSTGGGAKKIDGGQIYANLCVACHQASGSGLPGVFPPLDGSEWVTQDKLVPVKILLKGLQGPIQVKGAQYNGVMPAFESQISAAEIAAVVNYIRSSWSNKASDEVSEQEVEELKKELSARKQAWSADELKK